MTLARVCAVSRCLDGIALRNWQAQWHRWRSHAAISSAHRPRPGVRRPWRPGRPAHAWCPICSAWATLGGGAPGGRAPAALRALRWRLARTMATLPILGDRGTTRLRGLVGAHDEADDEERLGNERVLAEGNGQSAVDQVADERQRRVAEEHERAGRQEDARRAGVSWRAAMPCSIRLRRCPRPSAGARPPSRAGPRRARARSS
jgi:hypothetical protein